MKSLQKTLILALFFSGYFLSAQDSTTLVVNKYYNSLSKGNFILSLGTNLNTYVSKNEDQLVYYVLDEKNTRFNIKLGFGYYIKDSNPVGAGFRYYYDKSSITYENAVGDTINYNERTNEYVTNLFYGITKSLFNSKRVFIISDPSLFFSIGNTKSDRTFDNVTEYSRSDTYSISVGLNVGVMVFLAPKMSAQASVGPVGVGYQWENFYLDDKPNGSNANFFIKMTPNILNFEFAISRYF